MSLEWRGAAVAPDDEEPTPEGWEPVSVPGRPEPFAGADAVALRTEFADPRAGEECVVLHLHGAYAHTTVWCNGREVASHDSYLTPLRVRLPDADEYEVVVKCRGPTDRFGGLHDTDALPPERCVPGVWWQARVETRPVPYIDRLRARPRVTDDGAAVDVTAEVVAPDGVDDRLTLSLRPEGDARGGGMMDRAEAIGTGRTTVEHTLDVRTPSLWWPADHGEQPRYTVRATLGDDERTVTTGLREVRYDDGFVVNGRRVPARGVTLLDPTVEDVERAAEANANLVRVRAQGTPPAVAAACDEHGLLLWQDLPLTGPGAFDTDRAVDLADGLVDCYAHHPSLAAVAVHDEPIDSYADGLGSGLLDRVRFRWRAWRASYDPGPARETASTVDTVPTVPVVGPPGIAPDAVTLYPGWRYGDVEDLEWLCDRYGVGDAVAGIGAGAPGGAETSTSGRQAVRADGDRDAAQAHQERVVRRAVEMLRRRSSGVVTVDSLRDANGTGTGVLASDGQEKPAYRALADSYEPTQVLLSDPVPGESAVVVVHDGPTEASVTVEWDRDGDREQTETTVDTRSRTSVGTIDLADGDEVTLAVAVDDRVVTNEYRI